MLYHVTVKTADYYKAGTDAYVNFYMVDENGKSMNPHVLDSPQNDFEKGDCKIYAFNEIDLAPAKTIGLQLLSNAFYEGVASNGDPSFGSSPEWLPAWIEVRAYDAALFDEMMRNPLVFFARGKSVGPIWARRADMGQNDWIRPIYEFDHAGNKKIKKVWGEKSDFKTYAI